MKAGWLDWLDLRNAAVLSDLPEIAIALLHFQLYSCMPTALVQPRILPVTCCPVWQGRNVLAPGQRCARSTRSWQQVDLVMAEFALPSPLAAGVAPTLCGLHPGDGTQDISRFKIMSRF